MFEIRISHEAEKYYKRLDKKIKQKINQSMEQLSLDPFKGVRIKKLHGKLEGKFRYALSNLRIVYEVDIDDKHILIVAINTRGDVYKK